MMSSAMDLVMEFAIVSGTLKRHPKTVADELMSLSNLRSHLRWDNATWVWKT